jgi:hypothetical protein
MPLLAARCRALWLFPVRHVAREERGRGCGISNRLLSRELQAAPARGSSAFEVFSPGNPEGYKDIRITTAESRLKGVGNLALWHL